MRLKLHTQLKWSTLLLMTRKPSTSQAAQVDTLTFDVIKWRHFLDCVSVCVFVC